MRRGGIAGQLQVSLQDLLRDLRLSAPDRTSQVIACVNYVAAVAGIILIKSVRHRDGTLDVLHGFLAFAERIEVPAKRDVALDHLPEESGVSRCRRAQIVEYRNGTAVSPVRVL